MNSKVGSSRLVDKLSYDASIIKNLRMVQYTYVVLVTALVKLSIITGTFADFKASLVLLLWPVLFLTIKAVLKIFVECLIAITIIYLKVFKKVNNKIHLVSIVMQNIIFVLTAYYLLNQNILQYIYN